MDTPAPAQPLLKKEYISVLLTVALPVMFHNVISLGLNLIDLLMIGRLGVNELAAVGAASRVYSIFVMMCFGLICGFSVYTSQYWGVRDIKNIRRVYGLAATSMISLALLFVLLAAFFGRPILYLFVKDPAVVELSRQYLIISVFSFPFLAYSFCTSFSSRSLRRLVAVTSINALALAIKTWLNYLFLFGNFGMPRLGLTGAAWGTVIARVLEMIMMVIYIYGSREHPLAGKLRELFSFDMTLARKIFKTVLPVLGNESAHMLGMTLFYVIISYLGTEAVAVMQVSMLVNDFFLAIFFGLGGAVAVITGNELGRGHKELAYTNGVLALKVTVFLSLLIGALLFIARGPIVQLYSLGPVASGILSQVLTVCALYIPIRMLVYVLIIGLLRAGGDTRFCMFVQACTILFVGVPLAFTGALILQLPLYAVLALLLTCDLASLMICYPRFRSKVWINKLI